jgi:predicted oxidoreductase
MKKTVLSPVIAGTMNWGVWDKKLNTAEMAHLIRVCVDNQITTFDHADIYGGYTTEAEFGQAFTQSGLSRDRIQLISKCGIQHTQGRPNTLKHYDYSKDYILWSVDNSLKNLQTDYLDVLLLHRPSPLMQPDEIAEAVEILRVQFYTLPNRVNSPTDRSALQSNSIFGDPFPAYVGRKFRLYAIASHHAHVMESFGYGFSGRH